MALHHIKRLDSALAPSVVERTVAMRPSDLVGFSQRIEYYMPVERASGTTFIDASDDRRDPAQIAPLAGDSPQEQLVYVAARLASRGIEIAEVDVTSPDVAEAGMFVARALSPQLCPLEAIYDRPFRGIQRVLTEAVRLGYRRDPLDPAEINPLPHPFA